MMRMPGSGCVSPMDLDHGWSSLVATCIREMILDRNLRIDGRGLIDVRDSHHSLGCLRVPHGSVLSQMGDSQVLSTATIGSKRGRDGDMESSEPLSVIFEYLPHLNNSFQSRLNREQNEHCGDFVEQSLRSQMAKKDSFPFVTRVNVDSYGSDGSMAELGTTSASLALRDANVPLASDVVGLSVGLISDAQRPLLAGNTQTRNWNELSTVEPQQQELITDLLGLEEDIADMRLSTAGTKEGLVSALLECQVPGVSIETLAKALQQAAPIRQRLLSTLPRKKNIREGPQTGSQTIPKEHIGKLIGIGGATLKEIEDEINARILVNSDGVVHYFAPTPQQLTDVEQRIHSITGQAIREGERYKVTVTKIHDYGAFVKLPNGYEALLHISELADTKVRSVEEVLQLGQETEVLCLGRDLRGHVKLSRKALL